MTKKHNKLVRDKIPEIIEAAGKIPTYTNITGAQLVVALENKLKEEVGEWLAAQTNAARIEELADIYEVMWALIVKYGEKAFWAILQKKREERGLFRKGVFLISVEDNAGGAE